MDAKEFHAGFKVRFPQSVYELGIMVHGNTFFVVLAMFNYPIIGIACEYISQEDSKNDNVNN